MSNFVTLEQLGAEAAQYYIYLSRESGQSHMPHYHDYYQVCFVVSGQIRHSQGNDSVVLQSGDAFIVPPGFVHRLHFLGDSPELYTLAFHEMLLQSNSPQSSALQFLKDLQTHHETSTLHLRLTPDAQQRRSILSLMECLLRQQEADCPTELSAAPNLTGAIISILAQCYYLHAHNQRHPWNSTDSSQLLRRCIAYVNTHFTEPLTAALLSKKFGLSRSILCSAFQQRTGLPIHKYIAQKRVEQAQILIRSQPNTPLAEISAQSGFEDNSTFYRNFVKITGMSPTKYRELCKHQ